MFAKMLICNNFKKNKYQPQPAELSDTESVGHTVSRAKVVSQHHSARKFRL